MRNAVDKLIKIGVWVTAILFVIRCIPSIGLLADLWQSRDFLGLMYNTISYVGEAIAFGFIIVKLFDSWIWKWKVVQKFHRVPALAKEYKGELTSSFDNKDYKGNLIINQTFTKLSIKFKSNESSSYSIVASIIDNNDTSQLIYTYQNDPKANIQKRSPIHYGTAILSVDNVNKIEGSYYTSRGSVGYMVFTAISEEKRKR